MLRATLVLLLLCAAHPLRATWHVFGNNNATAIDFRSPHQGVLSLNDATHLIQTYEDGKLNGVFQAPDVVTGVIIQDSLIAWATVRGNGLYIGTKHWSSWKQTTAQSDLSLIAATPGRLFVYSLGQLYYTTSGATLAQTSGIPKGDSITAIDYLSDEVIFAASQTTVYRSTDAGQNWTITLANIAGCHSLYADRTHGIVYAGGDTLRKSTDGLHWNAIHVPAPFSWTRVWGYVSGAHDCTGNFYVTDTIGFDYNVIRSTDGGSTFEDVGPIPPLVSNVRKIWTFDRGATMWWWDWTTTKGISNLAWSDDGLNGGITDSLAANISATASTIYDTACGASKPLIVSFASTLCAPIRLDTIFAVSQIGKIAKTPILRTLQGDTASIALNYLPLAAGTDSIALRVTLHGLEWKFTEHLDITAYAVVANNPATLAASQALDFGTVRTDSQKTMDLRIKNEGCNALRVDSIASTNAEIFSVSTLSFPLFLKADSTLMVPVQFHPTASGPFIESIEIGTNAGHEFVMVDGVGLALPASVEDDKLKGIRIYPTVASSVLFASDDMQIVIYDVLGRTVLSSFGSTFDVSGVSPGAYFVRVADRIIPITIAR